MCYFEVTLGTEPRQIRYLLEAELHPYMYLIGDVRSAALQRRQSSCHICFIFIELDFSTGYWSQVTHLATGLLSLVWRFAPSPNPQGSKGPSEGPKMATATKANPTDRRLSENEFEELLQRTWELVQGQRQPPIVHPFESPSESPSWT
jgi:hypothetical protein